MNIKNAVFVHLDVISSLMFRKAFPLLVGVIFSLFTTNSYAENIFEKLVLVEDARDRAIENVEKSKSKVPELDQRLAFLAKRSDTAQRASYPIRRSVYQTMIDWEKLARRSNRASNRRPMMRRRAKKLIKSIFGRTIGKDIQKLTIIKMAKKDVLAFHRTMMERAMTTTDFAFNQAVVAQKESEKTSFLKGSKQDPNVIKAFDETAAKLAEKTKKLRKDDGFDFHTRLGTLRRPVREPLTYPFGPRHVTEKMTIRHTGQTWVIPQGTIVKACAPGTIIFRQSFPGYGNVIIIDHGGGYTSLYAHLETFLQPLGARVARGTEIAKSGESGSLDGPKLYFELRENGNPVDPEPWYLFR